MRALGGFAFAIILLIALGFLLWAMACIVQGYAAARQSGLARRSIFTFAAFRDTSHPANAHLRSFFSAAVGFAIAWCVSFILSIWFGRIS